MMKNIDDGSPSVHWDDAMLCRRKNMFWEQDYFSGQNVPIDLSLFAPNGMIVQ